MKQDIVQAVPPATVVAIKLLGLTLQDWVSVLGICLLIMQIGWFVYDKLLRGREKKRRGGHR